MVAGFRRERRHIWCLIDLQRVAEANPQIKNIEIPQKYALKHETIRTLRPAFHLPRSSPRKALPKQQLHQDKLHQRYFHSALDVK